MSKFRFLLFLLLCFGQSKAQTLQLQPYGAGVNLLAQGNKVSINPNSSEEIAEALQLQLQLPSNTYLEAGWRLEFRRTDHFEGIRTKMEFPIKKIFLKVKEVHATNAIITHPSQLGYGQGNFPLNNDWTPLINNSPYEHAPSSERIQITSQVNLLMEFVNNIEEYSMKEYPIQLEFRIIDVNNNIISVSNPTQIHLDVNGFGFINSIQVMESHPNPSNLVFNSMAAYKEGVQQVYEKAIRVRSREDYYIKVKAAADKFYSSNNKSIALSNLHIGLTNQDTHEYGEISLTDQNQDIITGTKTSIFQDIILLSQYFDVTYSIGPNKESLFHAASNTYSTTIIYTLEPQ